MELLKILEKYKRKRKPLNQLEEYKFFILNNKYFAKIPKFSSLTDKDYDEFDVFRMNIILHAYLNKVAIEEEASNLNTYMNEDGNFNIDKFQLILKEKLVDQPYYETGNIKIYIPFFSKAINLIYLNEPTKLLKFPYSSLMDDFTDTMVDPFDTYGYELYNSYFTRLIKVFEKDDEAVFFHYDTNTLYIVNSQGRLDGKIVLFDKFFRRPNYNHMMERIKPVIEAYFAYDKVLFIKSLREQGFMSSRLYYLIKIFNRRKLK